MYYTYMLRCMDNSIYTGITVDVKRRLEEHKERGKKAAKYTLVHKVEKIEAVWESDNKSLASKLEFNIKKLKKFEKEELIKTKELKKYLDKKIDIEAYKYVENLDTVL